MRPGRGPASGTAAEQHPQPGPHLDHEDPGQQHRHHNSPGCLWEINKGAWYDWPYYSAGVPVTDERYEPKDGPVPKSLLKDHPTVEKLLMILAPHTSATKFDFSPGGA